MTEASLDAAAASVFSAVLAATHLSRPDDLADELLEHAHPLGITSSSCTWPTTSRRR